GTAGATRHGKHCSWPTEGFGARCPPAATGRARGARQGGRETGGTADAGGGGAGLGGDAVREFRAFAVTGLLRVAVTSVEIPDTDQPWAPTPTVILARAVHAELHSVDDGDGPWERIQKRVTEEHQLLADG